MRHPKFLYFDLGNVLLTFDVGVICQRVAELVGIEANRVKEAVFDSRLQNRYELGEIDTQGYYDAFCRATATSPDSAALNTAICELFDLRLSIVPVIAQLREAGYRLGVLSNTCEAHWEYFTRRYAILRELFEVHALSYELRAAKPDPEIFLAAARAVRVKPEEIFFTDDVAGHVASACGAGLDAVQFTSTPQLVEDLRLRAVRFNY